MDLTSTIVRQMIVDDPADLDRVPLGCSRYFLSVCLFMEEDDELEGIPPSIRYDPKTDSVFAVSPSLLAEGVLECMRRLPQNDQGSGPRLERILRRMIPTRSNAPFTTP